MSGRLSLEDPVDASSLADQLLESTLPTAADHRQGDSAAATEFIEAHPDVRSANIWVAAATGDRQTVRRFIDQDPSLATAEGGTRGWDPLLYLCFSRLLRTDDQIAEAMLEIAGWLLDAGADPNSYWRSPDGPDDVRESALYGAAGVANRVELARLLVEYGASPNDGETAYHMVEHLGVPCADFIYPRLNPLQRGIALGHLLDYDDLEGLRRLLELGADPNGPTPFPNLPIHQAVWRDRSLPFFDLLSHHGADLDVPNGSGQTPYSIAARSHKAKVMEWLERSGASTSLSPIDRFIAACAAGCREEAEALLRAGEIGIQMLSARDHAEIGEAASAGNTVGVGTMLDLGWDANTRGPVWGETPAHRAAMEGHEQTLALLIARGADLTITDQSYRASPLGWAQHGGQTSCVELLRGFPEKLDLWDAIELDLTPRALEWVSQVEPNVALRGAAPGALLRLAVAKGNREIVEALMATGADPTLPSGHGPSALDMARSPGHHEILVALEGT